MSVGEVVDKVVGGEKSSVVANSHILVCTPGDASPQGHIERDRSQVSVHVPGDALLSRAGRLLGGRGRASTQSEE